MRRHKYQHDQTVGAWVHYGVFFTRTRMGCHARPEFSPLCPDLYQALTLDHIVDFVSSLMLMGRLLLSCFKAIHIAEHAVGLKDIDLLELLR